MKIQNVSFNNSRASFKGGYYEDMRRDRQNRRRLMVDAPIVAGLASIGAGVALALYNEPYVYLNEYGEELNRPYRDAVAEVIPNTINNQLSGVRNGSNVSLKYLDHDVVQLTSKNMDVVVEKDLNKYSVHGNVNGTEVNAIVKDNEFFKKDLPILLTTLGAILLLASGKAVVDNPGLLSSEAKK